MGGWNPYSKATPTANYYPSSASSGSTEVDLRQELIDMFNGTSLEIPKAQDGLLRRMRRDSSGELVKCSCVDSLTKEPLLDRFCPVCYGEGNLWDEENLQLYRTFVLGDKQGALKAQLLDLGLINIPIVVFYTRYDSNITTDDKIVTLELDNEGDVVSPLTRLGVYRIKSAWDYRADNGRIEYWKVFTHLQDVKYLNAPSYEDV
jgi:hypothetical protein